MVKRIVSVLIILSLLTVAFSLACFAEGVPESIPHVLDRAGLLSETEIDELEKTASSLTEKYSCGVYIYILDDYSKYSDYRVGIKQCAQDLYDEFKLGVDNGTGNRDLVLLVISMAERDYTVYTNGIKGNEVFNNTGINSLEDAMVPYLRNNNWYGGFSAFLEQTERLFENPLEDNLNAHSQYTTETYGYEKDEPRVSPFAVIITVFVPCLVALGVCNGFKRRMKNAAVQTTAEAYIPPRGIVMTDRRDIFLNRTVTRQIIQPQPDHRTGGGFSGGTGGHFSGGPSGHSGKF